jgi:hypothetical protein
MKRTVTDLIAIVVLLFPIVYWVMMPRTAYAPGYSEKNFSKIKVGMSTNDLVGLVSNPFREGPDGTSWLYSRPGHSPLVWSFWNLRGLTVSNGVVVQIVRSYRYYED